mmetsp:Transcript_6526/g.19809  ORF Transcript_6526/g.19809 Transcript_6526/m.19809 type:complete len:257 (-) Transcript_6526:176-946(-)
MLEELPDDVLANVLSNLDGRGRLTLREVSRRLRSFVETATVGLTTPCEVLVPLTRTDMLQCASCVPSLRTWRLHNVSYLWAMEDNSSRMSAPWLELQSIGLPDRLVLESEGPYRNEQFTTEEMETFPVKHGSLRRLELRGLFPEWTKKFLLNALCSDGLDDVFIFGNVPYGAMEEFLAKAVPLRILVIYYFPKQAIQALKALCERSKNTLEVLAIRGCISAETMTQLESDLRGILKDSQNDPRISIVHGLPFLIDR